MVAFHCTFLTINRFPTVVEKAILHLVASLHREPTDIVIFVTVSGWGNLYAYETRALNFIETTY